MIIKFKYFCSIYMKSVKRKERKRIFLEYTDVYTI